MARHHIAALTSSVLCTAFLAAQGAAVAGSAPVSLTSQRFTEAVKAHNVHLMTYRELAVKQGLTVMRRPTG